MAGCRNLGYPASVDMGSAVSGRDLQVIRWQLGREPRGVMAVKRRCCRGYPQVIQVYPLLNGEPFPTLFWLTCPVLVERLSRLESQGYIKRLEARITEDGALREELYGDHRSYIAERWAALSEADRTWIKNRGLAETFRKRGIGGISDWNKVKCLHLHYAHHLARGSAIGHWLENRFSIEECPPRHVICNRT